MGDNKHGFVTGMDSEDFEHGVVVLAVEERIIKLPENNTNIM